LLAGADALALPSAANVPANTAGAQVDPARSPETTPNSPIETAAPDIPDATAPPMAPPASTSPITETELDEFRPPKDPLEGFNRVSFRFSMDVDRALIRPAAMVYRHVVPEPMRDGVHNALSNLGEPLVFLNDFLQLRPKRMMRTLARFLINSTLGIGGLFDVAKHKPFYLPHHANSLGDTLGYYGVKPGPYIYLPILGPTTLRDVFGNSQEILLPKAVGSPFNRADYQVSTTVVGGIDQRERNDQDLKTMLKDAVDPYATFRSTYLQNREGEIASLKAREGEPVHGSELDEPLIDPAAPVPSQNCVPSAQ
jgi:phospholipid-binding lipoprotein MlaA